MAVFKWTSVGLKMRAVVESRRLSQLEGVNASGVAAGAWALSSVLAGLSGVLLLPIQNPLDPTNTLSFTTLLVAGITAAAIASLSSIPVAFFAGVAIGIVQNILTLALPSSSNLAVELPPAGAAFHPSRRSSAFQQEPQAHRAELRPARLGGSPASTSGFSDS